MHFVLVHSPVVGPSTWRWVAEELRELGHTSVVPDLREQAESGDVHAFIASAADAATDNAYVLVGHSGAGRLLPAIGASASQSPKLIVFVDAGLPGGTDGFLETLRSLAIDGVLPKWSQWFGDDVMSLLVHDEQRRVEVEADQPRIPLTFYETTPAPAPIASAAYVLLSDAYRAEADEAALRGWPVTELRGTHLELVNNPAAVAAAITTMA